MLGNQLSHYRIVEQIGAGGMGIVYRAHDEQLDRDVAIKVLPPGSLTDETAHKRFRKEALSLARLNHPNIATVHEFGSDGGTDFLVTEYIPGITLDAKLARGPLAPAEVTRLGLQLAAGLEAAHQQGVVHRDLKPGNLRLTTDGRLKILDFGLSQFMPHASSLGMTATLTQSQETTGTLPYMAPELLSGEIADARTDLWAAGAVLYEMATGKRPFPQAIPGLLISAILNQLPEPPDRVNTAVPANLNAVILKALERDRARRYQTASELARDLENLQSAVTVPLPIRRTKSSARIFGIGVLVVLLLTGGFFAYRRKKSSGVAGPRRRSVAVLGFKNLSASPEKAWLSTAISEMLTTELSQGDQLRTIPGESVALMKASLSLPDADSFGQQTLHRIRQNLGSDDVVLGSYVPLGSGQLRLDIRLQDTAAGVTLASVSEKGNETEIDSLVSQVGQELRGKLGVSALSDTESAAVRASLPSNPEAARLYSQGLQKLRLFDALAARDALEKAAQLVPDHAPTHAVLAEAYSRLGYEVKAKEQAKQALALSSNASREERLLIEARAHELSGETGQVVDNYKTLWKFFPDNVDYGLFLIRAQVTSGHPADAETTLAELRQRASSEVDSARIDLADANIAAALGNFKRQQGAAQDAASKGRTAGANLLVAQALQLQAQAEERMGQSKSPIDLLNQAKQLFDTAGERRASASVVLNVGDLLYDQGDYEGARKQFESALPVFREIGARRGIRAAIERIGNVFYSEGKMPEAKDYYQQTLALDREGGNEASALASDYGNLANALDSMGDLKGALKMQQQALDAFNQVGDKRGAGATLNNLGILFVELGELDEAQKYYEQALAMARETSYHRGEPDPMSGAGDVLLARGDLAGAKKNYEQAMAMCKEMSEEDSIAQLNTSLAMVALAEKRYSDGQSLAQDGANGYAKVNSAANEAWARAILARNLLNENKVPEATASAVKAVQLANQGVSPTPRYEALLADSRVKAKSGNVAEARKELETSIASAHKFGYRLYEYQLRLALGEISAGTPAANSQLTQLEKDANSHGALLIARQARELIGVSAKDR